MKHQVLFSLKNNEKIFRMSSPAVVIGTLRVKGFNTDVSASFKHQKMINDVGIRHFKAAKLKRQTRAFPRSGIAFSAIME